MAFAAEGGRQAYRGFDNPNESDPKALTSSGQQYGSASGAAYRLQNMGTAARGRTANLSDSYDQTTTAYNQTNQLQSRQGQLDAIGQARAAALGQTPSVAQLQGQNQLEDVQRGLLAAGASARGGGANLAAAQRNASTAAANAGASGAQNAAMLRAQEMAAARGQYIQSSQGLAASDLTASQLGQQNAQYNASLAAQQGAQNDQYQVAMEGLAGNAENAQLSADTGVNIANNQIELANQQASWQAAQSGVGAAAGLALLAASDENLKTDVSDAGSLDAMGSAQEKYGRSFQTGSSPYPDPMTNDRFMEGIEDQMQAEDAQAKHQALLDSLPAMDRAAMTRQVSRPMTDPTTMSAKDRALSDAFSKASASTKSAADLPDFSKGLMGMKGSAAPGTEDLKEGEYGAAPDVSAMGTENAQKAAGFSSRQQAGLGMLVGGIGGLGAAYGASRLSDERSKIDARGAGVPQSLEHLGVRPREGTAEQFLDSITPKTFRYKDPRDGDGRYLGVMAQDVEKTPIGREMVERGPDGMRYLRNDKLLPATLASAAALNQKDHVFEHRLARVESLLDRIGSKPAQVARAGR